MLRRLFALNSFIDTMIAGSSRSLALSRRPGRRVGSHGFEGAVRKRIESVFMGSYLMELSQFPDATITPACF